MAVGGLGLVKRASSFGRKRILILNHMDFDSFDVATPKKKQFLESKPAFCCQKSLLEALPQEILIKIVCGADHDDLKSLFHVSKPIREAALMAKKWHFEYNTPKKIPAFRCSLNFEEFSSSNFDELKATKQLSFHGARLMRKKLHGICVSWFNDGDL